MATSLNIINPPKFSKKALVWFLIILFSLTILLRINVVIEPLGTDQGIFSYIGMRLNQGALPYKDVWDHKPPLIFYLYQGLYKIFPAGQLTLFVFDTILIFLFAILVGWFIQKYLIKNSFVVSSLLFTFLMCTESLYEGGNLTEQYMILFQFFFYIGLWRYFKGLAKDHELFLSGSALGLAVLWKPVALISLAPLGLILLYKYLNDKKLIKLVSSGIFFLAGILLPHVLLYFYYANLGIWQDYLNCTYLFDLGLRQHDPTATITPLGNMLIFIKEQFFALLFLWTTFALAAFEYFKKKNIFKQYKELIYFWGIILVFDLLAACSAGRFFGHYFIQPLVPTVILATLILKSFNKERKQYIKIICILFLISLCFQIVKIATVKKRYPMDKAQIVGLYIQKRTAPQDKIYVNGLKTGIYFFAQRQAPWKYVHDLFMRVSPEKQKIDASRRMLRQKPKYIVITNPVNIFKPVQEAIVKNYRKTATIADYPIYKLNTSSN
ncbi:hypothetical protein ACFL5G_03390 [Candidatus Margulisiibacteriota bacterium]